MASSVSTIYTDSTSWENVDTPDSSTMRNSPAPSTVPAPPLSPPSYRSADANPATVEEMWNRFFDRVPFPPTNVQTSSRPAPAPTTPDPTTPGPPTPVPPKSNSRLSWFELRLLFCKVKTKDGLSQYDPREFRHGPHAATILFHVDRNETKAELVEHVWKLIREANPYYPSYKGDIDECMNGFVVERQNERGASERLWVHLDTVVAQLWEMGTEGLTAVKPDLFGAGSNELHVLLDFEN